MDLKGQLSNPGEQLETLDLRGSRASRRLPDSPATALEHVDSECDDGFRKEKGQHSNPASRQAQRRLKPNEIDELLAAYLAGDLVREIAARHRVSRTTVIGYVTRRGLPRRSEHGWTTSELSRAAALYADGSSLATVGAHFGIDASTVAKRLRRAGVPIRPRRGWT